MYNDLILAQTHAYESCSFVVSNYIQDAESRDYGASHFELNGKHIIFRISKITPTKIGQFVTLYKRSKTGPIVPFDLSDQFDFCVISVRLHERLGQFIFPKLILLQKGVISQHGVGGKRALRVYPPWDVTENTQAKRTQLWQLDYFVEIQLNVDQTKLRRLFCL